MQTLIVIVIVFLVLLLFGMIMYTRKQSEEKSVTYVCTDCGETECICHREDEV